MKELTEAQREVRRNSPKGKQFGPNPEDFDPYDRMTDEELDAVVMEAIEAAKTVPVSIRLPKGLLQRTKAEAERRGVPYQTFIRTQIGERAHKLCEERLRPIPFVHRDARVDPEAFARPPHGPGMISASPRRLRLPGARPASAGLCVYGLTLCRTSQATTTLLCSAGSARIVA